MLKMGKAGVVIAMNVRQDHLANISFADAECAKLRANLLFGFDLEPDAKLKIRMPNGKRFQMRRLAGIDDNDPFPMLDGPGVSRQPAAPVLIEQHTGLAGE